MRLGCYSVTVPRCNHRWSAFYTAAGPVEFASTNMLRQGFTRILAGMVGFHQPIPVPCVSGSMSSSSCFAQDTLVGSFDFTKRVVYWGCVSTSFGPYLYIRRTVTSLHLPSPEITTSTFTTRISLQFTRGETPRTQALPLVISPVISWRPNELETPPEARLSGDSRFKNTWVNFLVLLELRTPLKESLQKDFSFKDTVCR